MAGAVWVRGDQGRCLTRWGPGAGEQEFAKTRDGLGAFLTYADNAAVGYFKKQGFSAAITLPREKVSLPQPCNPLDPAKAPTPARAPTCDTRGFPPRSLMTSC